MAGQCAGNIIVSVPPPTFPMCYKGFLIQEINKWTYGAYSPLIPETGYIVGSTVDFVKGRIDYYGITGDQC